MVSTLLASGPGRLTDEQLASIEDKAYEPVALSCVLQAPALPKAVSNKVTPHVDAFFVPPFLRQSFTKG
jgi:hypothetical protein